VYHTPPRTFCTNAHIPQRVAIVVVGIVVGLIIAAMSMPRELASAK
jgi:hypothetical protein